MLDMASVASILSASDKLRRGMERYKGIMDALHRTNVATDRAFQKAFNGFFVMRSRKSAYYDMFYLFLEQKKEKGVSFAETLAYLKGAEGRLETSFSSKLVHVIDPGQPIWDKNVAVQHFGLKLPGYGLDRDARQAEIVRVYETYCEQFYAYMASPEGKTVIDMFDEKYPDAGSTDVKKVDFILWADV